ncbi:hypothetical protein LJB42_002956 [Komagataella kurtzmanii]|nr:hypothetical protein LJB42_002956 [Komagataella kurtzmanii]
MSSKNIENTTSSRGSDNTVIVQDSFTNGLAGWKVEQQDPSGTVTARDGILEIIQPSGATIWLKQKLVGNYEITFDATPIPFTIEGTKFIDRISDLNMFWNATDPTTEDGDVTKNHFDASLNSYNSLNLYYVGFGANSNGTTRLRRNDGSVGRPQITGYSTDEHRTVDDHAGPMSEYTRLYANTPTRVKIASIRPTKDDPVNLKWYANEKLIFGYEDAKPYLEGWFGFRTITSHWKISNFKVTRLNE